MYEWTMFTLTELTALSGFYFIARECAPIHTVLCDLCALCGLNPRGDAAIPLQRVYTAAASTPQPISSAPMA